MQAGDKWYLFGGREQEMHVIVEPSRLAARGITITALSTELDGVIDLQGLLDLDPQVPVGYESIRIRMHIEADCSDEELDEVCRRVHALSPRTCLVLQPVTPFGKVRETPQREETPFPGQQGGPLRIEISAAFLGSANSHHHLRQRLPYL